jgi:hypothetical protein
VRTSGAVIAHDDSALTLVAALAELQCDDFAWHGRLSLSLSLSRDVSVSTAMDRTVERKSTTVRIVGRCGVHVDGHVDGGTDDDGVGEWEDRGGLVSVGVDECMRVDDGCIVVDCAEETRQGVNS